MTPLPINPRRTARKPHEREGSHACKAFLGLGGLAPFAFEFNHKADRDGDGDALKPRGVDHLCPRRMGRLSFACLKSGAGVRASLSPIDQPA
jgi:hypothetical protein